MCSKQLFSIIHFPMLRHFFKKRIFFCLQFAVRLSVKSLRRQFKQLEQKTKTKTKDKYTCNDLFVPSDLFVPG